MKYLVISDIHDNLKNLEKVLSAEKDFDVVIFLGDLVSPFTMRLIISKLPEDTRIIGVFGNNDGDKTTIIKASKGKADLVNYPRVEKLEQTNAILLHGFGSPENTKKIINAFAKSLDFNLVLYGHTHKPEITLLNRKKLEFKPILKNFEMLEAEVDLNSDVLILNPGEVGGWLYNNPTYAVLELKQNKKLLVYLKKIE